MAQGGVALIEPADGTYKNGGHVVLSVPPGLPEIDYTTFQVEIDQIDMSDVTTFNDDKLTVALPAPLSAGAHFVSLLASTTSGQYVEIESWTLQSEGAATAAATGTGIGRPYVLTSQNSVEILRRLHSENIDGDTKTTAISGAGRLSIASLSNGPWSMETSANYFVESQKTASPTGKHADIGQYSIGLQHTSEKLDSNFIVGQQNLGLNTFTMSGFDRRGQSAEFSSSDLGVRANVFNLAADSLIGVDDGFGTAKRSGYVRGTSLTTAPYTVAGNNTVQLTGIYYTGEEGRSGTGIAGVTSDSAGRGDGWGGALDSVWLDKRLRLGTEFAATSYDFDGAGTDVTTDHANAVALRGNFDVVQGAMVSGSRFDLSMNGGWERVDTFYQSIANPGLARDRGTFYAGADVLWGGLVSTLDIRQETNNVDDLPGLPTDRTRSVALDNRYNFQIERENPQDRAWMGMPYLMFGGTVGRTDRTKDALIAVGGNVNNGTDTVNIGIGSTYEKFSGQVTYTRTYFRDSTDFTNAQNTGVTDFSMQWYPSDTLSFSGGLQHTFVNQTDLNTTTGAVNGFAGLSATFMDEAVKLSIDYNMNLQEGTTDTHGISSELGWTVRKAERNSPGVEFALQNSSQFRSGGSNDQGSMEVFGVLRFTAPVER